MAAGPRRRRGGVGVANHLRHVHRLRRLRIRRTVGGDGAHGDPRGHNRVHDPTAAASRPSPGTPPPPCAPRWRLPPATPLEGSGTLKAFFELRHAEQRIRQQPVHRAHVRWSSAPRRANHHHGHRGHDQRRRRGRGDHPRSGQLVVTPIPSRIRSCVSHGSRTPQGHGHLRGSRTATSPGTSHSPTRLLPAGAPRSHSATTSRSATGTT